MPSSVRVVFIRIVHEKWRRVGRVQAGLVKIGPGEVFSLSLAWGFCLVGLVEAELACQISGGAKKHFH